MKKVVNNINIKNKKARWNYQILDEYVAGVMLVGSEVKSIRSANASIQEAYCYIRKGEVWVKGMHIAEYTQSSYNNHDPYRERKLLLNKKEIRKMEERIGQKGQTIVPLNLFINEKGLIKMKIALCKGKDNVDKRQDIKGKDIKRDTDRELKKY